MNPAWIKALALVCTFAAVVLATEVLARAIAAFWQERRAIEGRLNVLSRGNAAAGSAVLIRRASNRGPEWLPRPLDGWIRQLEHLVVQAQLSIEVPRLLLLLMLAPIACFFGLLLLMSLYWGVGISSGRIVLAAALATVVGGAIPLIAISWRAARNRKKMEEQFPVALDVFVRALRAGHPVAAALDLLSIEVPAPMGPEFGTVVHEVTYGAELRDALQSMAERWDLGDMKMFVVSLSVQNETGGNLAEILENLAKVVRERHSLFMKVRALSSEGRMTALMLTILPLFTFTLLFTLNPSFFLDVANDPWFVPGFTFLGLLYLAGLLIIRRMIDLKV